MLGSDNSSGIVTVRAIIEFTISSYVVVTGIFFAAGPWRANVETHTFTHRTIITPFLRECIYRIRVWSYSFVFREKGASPRVKQVPVRVLRNLYGPAAVTHTIENKKRT
jgi:hypothetical protein